MKATKINIGDRFGKLVVLGEAPKETWRSPAREWVCRCDCGNIHQFWARKMASGRVRSCGRCAGNIHVGDRFGKLVIVGAVPPEEWPAYANSARGPGHLTRNRLWDAICDCGTRTRLMHSNLVAGRTRSCGCGEATSNLRHEHCRRPRPTSTYAAWCGMKQRCLNPNDPGYHRYGGKGVMVCDRWLVFDNFLEDMGVKPTPEHWLKRVNTDDSYYPENCYWQPPEEREKKPKRKVRLWS